MDIINLSRTGSPWGEQPSWSAKSTHIPMHGPIYGQVDAPPHKKQLFQRGLELEVKITTLSLSLQNGVCMYQYNDRGVCPPRCSPLS